MRIYSNLIILTVICSNLQSTEYVDNNIKGNKINTSSTFEKQDKININGSNIINNATLDVNVINESNTSKNTGKINILNKNIKNNVFNTSVNINKTNALDNSIFDKDSNIILDKNILNNTFVGDIKKIDLDNNILDNNNSYINDKNAMPNNISANDKNQDNNKNIIANNKKQHDKDIAEYYDINGEPNEISKSDIPETFNSAKALQNKVESIVKSLTNEIPFKEQLRAIMFFINEWHKNNEKILLPQYCILKYTKIFRCFTKYNLSLIFFLESIENNDKNLQNIIQKLKQYFYKKIQQLFGNVLRYALYNKFNKDNCTLPEIDIKLRDEVNKQDSYIEKNINIVNSNFVYTLGTNVSRLNLILNRDINPIDGFLDEIKSKLSEFNKGKILNKYKTILDFINEIHPIIKHFSSDEKDILNNSRIYADVLQAQVENLEKYGNNYFDNIEEEVLNILSNIGNKWQMIDAVHEDLVRIINRANNLINNLNIELYNKLNEKIESYIILYMMYLLKNYPLNPEVVNIDKCIKYINIFNRENDNHGSFNDLLNKINTNQQVRLIQFLKSCMNQIYKILLQYQKKCNELMQEDNYLKHKYKKLNKIWKNISGKDINKQKEDINKQKEDINKQKESIKTNLDTVSYDYYNILINFYKELIDVLPNIINKDSGINNVKSSVINSTTKSPEQEVNILCRNLLDNTKYIIKQYYIQKNIPTTKYLIYNEYISNIMKCNHKTLSTIDKYVLDIYKNITNNSKNNEENQTIIIGITNKDNKLITIENYLNEIMNNINEIMKNIKNSVQSNLSKIFNFIVDNNIPNNKTLDMGTKKELMELIKGFNDEINENKKLIINIINMVKFELQDNLKIKNNEKLNTKSLTQRLSDDLIKIINDIVSKYFNIEINNEINNNINYHIDNKTEIK